MYIASEQHTEDGSPDAQECHRFSNGSPCTLIEAPHEHEIFVNYTILSTISKLLSSAIYICGVYITVAIRLGCHSKRNYIQRYK